MVFWRSSNVVHKLWSPSLSNILIHVSYFKLILQIIYHSIYNLQDKRCIIIILLNIFCFSHPSISLSLPLYIYIHTYIFSIFGGLVQDIKRRAPHYVSDFTDAIHVQCCASFIFLYFACLTPIITFGGLLAQATGGYLVSNLLLLLLLLFADSDLFKVDLIGLLKSIYKLT